MSLYFIRHGQTALNSKRMFNGEVNEELNEVGLKQATEAAKQFEGIRLDMIYCSPLTRTRQTLEALNLDKSIPVKYDERLVERRCGELAGTYIDDDTLQNFFLNRFTTKKVEGCETVDEVFSRVHSVIDEIKRDYSDKNVLIVAHGFVGRAVYFYFNPIPENGLLGSKPESFLQNCNVFKFDF